MKNIKIWVNSLIFIISAFFCPLKIYSSSIAIKELVLKRIGSTAFLEYGHKADFNLGIPELQTNYTLEQNYLSAIDTRQLLENIASQIKHARKETLLSNIDKLIASVEVLQKHTKPLSAERPNILLLLNLLIAAKDVLVFRNTQAINALVRQLNNYSLLLNSHVYNAVLNTYYHILLPFAIELESRDKIKLMIEKLN